MRREEREIKSRQRVEEILQRAQVGRLGTLSQEGGPMIKPVNFLYSKGRIYFHSSFQGEKMGDLALNPRVCFEVDEAVEYIPASGSPCTASFAYLSVIILGLARLVEDPEEKIRVLNQLTEKYQPGTKLSPLTRETVQNVAVVEIVVEKLTGKENLPPGFRP
ncbi:MAG: pyridoxamine 5'-phosphate oxidase family protein [Deltaproteobacteria bacterium]|nr:pyridoxamine 5'-phosphate oxidase family protein [Deltaproteobacteria bacterium]MBW2120701.1 pyridoxamine 5'-phosphate oxidase family protein [Deltaproteobacteria bacterium]